jgi:hypothetical protein
MGSFPCQAALPRITVTKKTSQRYTVNWVFRGLYQIGIGTYLDKRNFICTSLTVSELGSNGAKRQRARLSTL